MDHVELSLNLVTSDVVDRARVFVKDQVFCRRWKPAETQPLSARWTKCCDKKLSDRNCKPLHPLLVLVCFQNKLWSHVDHQRSRVLRPTCLVSGGGDNLNFRRF